MNTNNETEGKMHSKTTEQKGEVPKRFRFKIWQIESCEENIPYLFTDSEFLINHESTVFPPPKDLFSYCPIQATCPPSERSNLAGRKRHFFLLYYIFSKK